MVGSEQQLSEERDTLKIEIKGQPPSLIFPINFMPSTRGLWKFLAKFVDNISSTNIVLGLISLEDFKQNSPFLRFLDDRFLVSSGREDRASQSTIIHTIDITCPCPRRHFSLIETRGLHASFSLFLPLRVNANPRRAGYTRTRRLPTYGDQVSRRFTCRVRAQAAAQV